MRPGRNLLAAAALVAAAACTNGESAARDGGGNEVARKEQAMSHYRAQDANLAAEVTVTADGRTLTIKTRITNRAQTAIFLLDGLRGEVGNDGVLPIRDEPWVELSGDAALLSRKLIDPPADTLVESLNLPLPTRVAPGASVERTMTVALPLVPATPYRRFKAPADPSVRPLPTFFDIGYLIGRPGIESMARKVRTSEGDRMAFASISSEGQQILRVGPMDSVPAVMNAVRD